MWKLEPSDDYERRHKWYEKKRPRELRAVLNNLDNFLEALCNGTKSQHIRAGYIHPEPGGVLAFDQKGGGGNLAQTRLYTLPEEPAEILHLITLGGKDTQQSDLVICKNFVDDLQNERERERQRGRAEPEAIYQREGDGPRIV